MDIFIGLFINAALFLLGILVGVIGMEMWEGLTFRTQETKEDNKYQTMTTDNLPGTSKTIETTGLGAVQRPSVEDLDKIQHPIKQQEEDVWEEVVTEIKGMISA